MRIVVTGREGQVVRSLLERGSAHGHEIIPLGRPELDLSGHKGAIGEALRRARPEAIVSTAAFTAVDRAEDEPDLAFAINERGAGAVAQLAQSLAIPLVHLSTDYVFDGSKPSPYRETDAPSPTGVYGASKLAGEEAVLRAHDNVAVLRTAWVYSPYGSNFVKTMLQLAADRDEIAVVADQRGNPTSAIDIAEGILAIVANLAERDDPERRGIFHMAGSGEATWAELASEVFAASAALGGPTARVRPIATADYPTTAKRPADTRLDCTKLQGVHGVRLPEWRNSVGEVIARLIAPRPLDEEGKLDR